MFKTFRQAPFLRIALFFIAGILIQYYYSLAFCCGYLACIALIFLILSCFPRIRRQYRRRNLFGTGLLLFTLACAVYLTQQAWRQSEWTVEGFHRYWVRVIDEPLNKPGSRMCKVEIISADSSIRRDALNKKVIIYLQKDSLSERIVAGNCLRIRASLKKPQALPGDDSFDYPLYLRKKSYSAVAFVRQRDWQEKNLPLPWNRRLQMKSLEVRRNLFAHLRIILPDSQSFAVAAALMFGYQGELDRELRQSFANIGAGHILAVSGLHFNLIFGIAYFFLSFLGMSRKSKIIKQLILLPVIWGFAFITGLSPSVIRAAGMLSLWGIGDSFLYKSFTMNTLAAVALFMLLYNPLYLFDIGFQLSFLAVASILIVNPYLVELYSSGNRIINYLWELVCVSFSAQIGVLPLSLYYFHQFPLLFLVTNLLLIPLSGILMAAIPFSLLLYAVAGNCEYLFFPLRWLMSCFLSITGSLNDVPGGTLSGIRPGAFDTFLLYAATSFILYLLVRNRRI
ncbi:MAG: ComEC family competence protein [Candidatus Symbiothrix sp.]|jgi:competence protein ComEC|nr:ComEC family competence protein [Candidatus Symbiothrix sp.]